MLREKTNVDLPLTFDEFLALWENPYGYMTTLIRCAQEMRGDEDIPLAERSADYLIANLCLEALVGKAHGSEPDVPAEIRARLLTELFPDSVIQLLMAAINPPRDSVVFWSAPGVTPEREEPLTPTPAVVSVPKPPRQKTPRQPQKRAAHVDTPKPPKKTKPPKPEPEEVDNPEGSPTTYDTLGLYLKQMGEAPLLTAEEEIELAKRIEVSKEATAKRNRLLKKESLSSREEKTLLELEKLIEDGQAAREHLARSNTRLVVSISKKYMGRGLPFPDLIQEGNVGLMRAVDKFDYKLRNRFSTYATWWIRQALTRGLADKGRTIRVPVHMSDSIRALYRIERELTQELGHEPSIEETARFYVYEEVGVIPEEVLHREFEGLYKQKVKLITKLVKARRDVLSLDRKINDEDDGDEAGDFIADESASAEKPADSAMMKTFLLAIMDEAGSWNASDKRLMEVLRLRYGLDDENGGEGRTLEEVGNAIGVTRERARQLEAKALRLLRQPRYQRLLRDLL